MNIQGMNIQSSFLRLILCCSALGTIHIAWGMEQQPAISKQQLIRCATTIKTTDQLNKTVQILSQLSTIHRTIVSLTASNTALSD